MKYEIVSRSVDLKKYSNFVIPVFSDIKPKDLSYEALLSKLFAIDINKIKREERFYGGDAEDIVFRVGMKTGTKRFIFMGFGKQRLASTFLIRRRMQRAGQIVRMRGYRDPVIIFPDYPPSGLRDGMEAALVGFSLGAAHPLRFKTSIKQKKVVISRIFIYWPDGRDKNISKAIGVARSLAPAVLQVRELVDRPPNMKGPEEMAGLVSDFVSGKGISVKIHRLKKGTDSAFPLVYWVGRGSARKPLVVEMSYRPREKGKYKTVVLVGKGVIFDTGGLNIKSFHHMANMKDDMAGSAVVAGAIAAASGMGLKLNVTALLPMAENTPSADAYRPSDILKSRVGKTIEVISTDAEGRLLLADTLTYGMEKEPDYLIDVATLTGACMVALGPFVGGLFASDDLLAKMLEEAASSAGELLWRMPLIDEMMPFIRSDLADLRNTPSDPHGGAIGAALFLREFVGDVPWAHLDIAGPAFFEKRYEVAPRGATGHTVHTLVRFLENLSENQ